MSRRWLLATLACAGLVAVGLLVYLSSAGDPPERPPTAVHQDKPQADRPERSRRRASPQRAAGMRVRIPAIGVSARVVKLGLDRSGELEVPRNYDEVGLWAGGPRPGEPGAAVLAGHVDHRVTGPAVFYRLGEVDRGDAVEVIDASGRRARFTVERVERHPKDQFPTLRVYGWTDEPTLRLVTCTGDFDESSGHYRDNLIVFARRARASS